MDVSLGFLELIFELPKQYKRALLPLLDLNAICEEVINEVSELSEADRHAVKPKGLDKSGPKVPHKYILLHEKLWALEKVSLFIPTKHLPSPQGLTRDSPTCEVFQKAWEYFGGVPHLVRVMALHPEFIVCWLRTMQSTMTGDGPLSDPVRHYIALLASSAHDCDYLMVKEEQLFKENDGESSWLRSLECAPEKMKKIGQLNVLLAHQPWLVSKEDIQQLIEVGWSRGQIAHALLIMASYHSLCGMVYSCGILPDQQETSVILYDSLSETSADELLAQSCDLTPDLFSSAPSGSRTDIDVDALGSFWPGENGNGHVHRHGKYFLPNDHGVTHHEDFDDRRHRRHVMSEFNWTDHAFGVLSDCDLWDQADHLQAEFDHVVGMTDHSFGGKDVDTSAFRRMVWLYVHRVYGIVHDDFNYQLVNTLFTDPNIVKIVKSFVKRTAGHPETFLSSHFYEWGYPVDIKERVHVALLSCESRKQAELIHGLRALSQAFIT
jgi:sestrin